MERCRHLPTLAYTHRIRDGFRKRFWVRCWHCGLQLGPYARKTSALECMSAVWRSNAYLVEGRVR